jgi:hypothetical protein
MLKSKGFMAHQVVHIDISWSDIFGAQKDAIMSNATKEDRQPTLDKVRTFLLKP